MAELRMHPFKLGNFKDPKAKLRRKEPLRRAERPGMSDAHLDLIRQLPCARCGSPSPSEPHHLKSLLSSERGMARRSSDQWAVPLGPAFGCGCHAEVEKIGTKNEVAWFGEVGIDPHELAMGLWNVTGDKDRMLRVLQAHRENGSA